MDRRVVLEAALIGLRQRMTEMNSTIIEIEQELRGKNGGTYLGLNAKGQPIYGDGPTVPGKNPKGALAGKSPLKVVVEKPKRQMSAAARKRIAAAQVKRWQAYHAAKAKTA